MSTAKQTSTREARNRPRAESQGSSNIETRRSTIQKRRASSKPIDEEKQERKGVRRRLQANVGEFRTLGEVERANQWMTSLQCTRDDELKFEAFNKHAGEIGLEIVWPEVIMYRAIGQISTHLFDGQSLRDDGDLLALDDLESSVVGWVQLASEGRLDRLDEVAEIEESKETCAPVAARFEALLLHYKRKNNFEVWNHNRMKMLRYMIYRIVREPRDERHLFVQPCNIGQARVQSEDLYSATPQPRSSNPSVTISQAPAGPQATTTITRGARTGQ